MWYYVVWYKFTGISEEHTVDIFRARGCHASKQEADLDPVGDFLPDYSATYLIG